MTFRLTKDLLRAAYAFLGETDPFRRWNLPDADDVDFKVARCRRHFGWHYYEPDSKRHTVAISAATVLTPWKLLETMGHEMIHVHERNAGACGQGQHSAAFRKWAAQVCHHHGFDMETF